LRSALTIEQALFLSLKERRRRTGRTSLALKTPGAPTPSEDDDELSRAEFLRVSRFREHHADTDDLSDETILRIIEEVDREAEEAARRKRPN
jgi:hypothetical protein